MRVQKLFFSLIASFILTLLLLTPGPGSHGVNAVRLPDIGFAPDQIPLFDFFMKRKWAIASRGKNEVQWQRSPVKTKFSRDESPDSFWDNASDLGGKIATYTNALLQQAVKIYPSVENSISTLQNQISSIVSSPGIQALRSELETSTSSLDTTIVNTTISMSQDLTTFTSALSTEFESIMDQFELEFPPPNQAPNHEERVSLINALMDRLEDGLVKVANSTHYGYSGIEAEKTREIFETIRPGIVGTLVVVGDIAEQHPELLEAVLFSAIGLLLPEAWLLRPFLTCFGFGPTGPIKGSTAAWAQSRFWGGAVASGSWFARLQQAGMTGWGSSRIPQVVLGAVVGGVGLGLGLCGCRRG